MSDRKIDEILEKGERYLERMEGFIRDCKAQRKYLMSTPFDELKNVSESKEGKILNGKINTAANKIISLLD